MKLEMISLAQYFICAIYSFNILYSLFHFYYLVFPDPKNPESKVIGIALCFIGFLEGLKALKNLFVGRKQDDNEIFVKISNTLNNKKQ